MLHSPGRLFHLEHAFRQRSADYVTGGALNGYGYTFRDRGGFRAGAGAGEDGAWAEVSRWAEVPSRVVSSCRVGLSERSHLLTGFRLAEWVIKPEDGSLTSPTATARLEPLLMDLLVFLCSRARQAVPEQDVLDAVWGGRLVSDETVKGSLYQLRKAL